MAAETEDDTRWVAPSAALGLVLVGVLVLGIVFANLPVSPRAAGDVAYEAGRAIVITLIAALVAAASWTRARLLFFGAVLVGLGAQGFLVLDLAGALAEQAGATLGEADRVAPIEETRDGERWFRQSSLGFMLAIPESLRFTGEDPALASIAADRPELAISVEAWRWQSVDGNRYVLVLASAMGLDDPSVRDARFAAWTEGVRDAIGGEAIQVVADETNGLDRRIRFLDGSNGAVGLMRLVAYARQGRLIGVGVVALGAGEILDGPATSLRVIP